VETRGGDAESVVSGVADERAADRVEVVARASAIDSMTGVCVSMTHLNSSWSRRPSRSAGGSCS